MIYFYYHVTLTLVLGVLAVLDSMHCYWDDWITPLPFILRVVVVGAMGVVVWQAVLLPIVAPILSLRLLWIAREGGRSFIGIALCDAAITAVQWFALLMLCS